MIGPSVRAGIEEAGLVVADFIKATEASGFVNIARATCQSEIGDVVGASAHRRYYVIDLKSKVEYDFRCVTVLAAVGGATRNLLIIWIHP